MKLNLGCGRDIRAGWVNIDSVYLDGVDAVVDFDDWPKLPFDDDTVAYSEASHVIEHLHRPLPFMEELWRVTKPGGTVRIRCPYGSSDDADEDPTHVRRLYVGSWEYFGQPNYWRADYGYRGDWRVSDIMLFTHSACYDLDDAQIAALIQHQRNIVAEMVVTMVAVKPAREPRRDLQQISPVTIKRLRG